MKKCVYPGCENSRRTRGLCHGHYQGVRRFISRGDADEKDLVSRGLMLPADAPDGGAKINGLDAFKLGSKVRGSAKKG